MTYRHKIAGIPHVETHLSHVKYPISLYVYIYICMLYIPGTATLIDFPTMGYPNPQ